MRLRTGLEFDDLLGTALDAGALVFVVVLEARVYAASRLGERAGVFPNPPTSTPYSDSCSTDGKWTLSSRVASSILPERMWILMSFLPRSVQNQ